MEELMQIVSEEMECLDENEIEERKAKGRRYALEVLNVYFSAMDRVKKKIAAEESAIVMASFVETWTSFMVQNAPTEEFGKKAEAFLGDALSSIKTED